MKMSKVIIVTLATILCFGQFVSAEVSKIELKSIHTPDQVETSIGTLKFFDGVPKDEIVKTLYDNLDRMRGVEVFLNCIPGVSMWVLTKRRARSPSKVRMKKNGRLLPVPRFAISIR